MADKDADGPWNAETQRLATWLDANWPNGIPQNAFRQMIQLLLAEQRFPGEADAHMWASPPPAARAGAPMTWEPIARSICAETCAFRGEPACFLVEDDQGKPLQWPAPACDEPGCEALAKRVLARLEYAAPEAPLPGQRADVLIARLMQIRMRIGHMCSEGHPPRMSIPASRDDDDLFICEAVDDAIAALRATPSPAGQQGEAIDGHPNYASADIVAKDIVLGHVAGEECEPECNLARAYLALRLMMRSS